MTSPFLTRAMVSDSLSRTRRQRESRYQDAFHLFFHLTQDRVNVQDDIARLADLRRHIQGDA